MGNAYLDTNIVDRAIKFAVKAHENSERRGKKTPYILHPLEAGAIVATITNDQELIAAAILHDVVEDTKYTVEDIQKEFGDRVAKITANETVMDDGSLSWKERKQLTINHVRNSSLDSKIVALGDKLSNMRAINMDYLDLGDKLWDRFHCNDKKEIAWYYITLGEALSELKDTHAYKEYIELINKTFVK